MSSHATASSGSAAASSSAAASNSSAAASSSSSRPRVSSVFDGVEGDDDVFGDSIDVSGLDQGLEQLSPSIFNSVGFANNPANENRGEKEKNPTTTTPATATPTESTTTSATTAPSVATISIAAAAASSTPTAAAATGYRLNDERRGLNDEQLRALQHVQVSHSMDNSNGDPNTVLGRPAIAPLGSDGRPMTTTVCAEIEESVIKASRIEEQLHKSKVYYCKLMR